MHMGMHHKLPNVPIKDIPIYTPPLQTPPVVQSTPSAPLPSTPAHAVDSPASNNGQGNGMPWCSGPNAPGYNVSTGKCDNHPINAITPKTEMSATSSRYLHLNQLPSTGSNDVDFYFAFCLALVIPIVLGYYSVKLTRVT